MTIYYCGFSLVIGTLLKSLVQPIYIWSTLIWKEEHQNNHTALSEECPSPQILLNSSLLQWLMACVTFAFK